MYSSHACSFLPVHTRPLANSLPLSWPPSVPATSVEPVRSANTHATEKAHLCQSITLSNGDTLPLKGFVVFRQRQPESSTGVVTGLVRITSIVETDSHKIFAVAEEWVAGEDVLPYRMPAIERTNHQLILAGDVSLNLASSASVNLPAFRIWSAARTHSTTAQGGNVLPHLRGSSGKNAR